MPVTGLNHVTLQVSDLSRSLAFYTDTLGARLRASWASGAYLELGDIWLCLSKGSVTPRTDYTHLAFSCAASDYPSLAVRISARAALWQENTSEGDSIYFLDPDGHRLELHQGGLADRLAYYSDHPEAGVTIHP